MNGRKRVLLADDHPASANAVRAALVRAGYEVWTAASLEEASRLTEQMAPSVVLLDVGLPGGRVEEFCARLRAGWVPVILLVPPRFPAEPLERLRPLADGRLYKPFLVDDLVGKVADVVRQAGQASAPPGGPAVGEEEGVYLPDLAGREVGGCHLERLIGRGSSGAVYLGRHKVLEVPVAVKVMPVSGAGNAELERFLRGARVAARVQHPHVAPVLNAGRGRGFCFLVQRYVEGETLRRRMEAQGRLSERSVRAILRDIASALAAAHHLGVIHRDVKPSNIILTPAGRAVLTDFGLARAAGPGDISSASDVVGTPYYMSPEQCSGLAVDERSDLYSLGATAYHALTGRRPAEGDTVVAVLRAHVEEVPPPPRALVPEVSEGLSALLMRLLAKRREERCQSAGELLEALRSLG